MFEATVWKARCMSAERRLAEALELLAGLRTAGPQERADLREKIDGFIAENAPIYGKNSENDAR